MERKGVWKIEIGLCWRVIDFYRRASRTLEHVRKHCAEQFVGDSRRAGLGFDKR